MKTHNIRQWFATGLLIAILAMLAFGSPNPARGGIGATATQQLTISPTPDQTDSPSADSDASVRFGSVRMLNISDGWAEALLSNADIFLHTQDGGKTWVNVTPPGYGSGVTIANYATQYLDTNHAWIAYIDSQTSDLNLWRTENAGQSWTKTTLSARSMNAQQLGFIDPKQGWLLLVDCCAAGNEFAELY